MQPSTSVTSGLRERKKHETRDRIVRAATQLFAAKGFEATTVDEIAEAAGVSRRTFFRYFATKELVVFPHQEAYAAMFRRVLGERTPDEPPFASVRRACLAVAQAFMRSREDHLEQQRIIQASPALIARGDAFDEEWESLLAGVFASGAGEGGPAGERRARLVAGAVMGVIRAALREWYANACRENLVELGDEALRLVERGAAGVERKQRIGPRRG